ncbi:MAG: IclR family transcriptional regulator [Bacteroidota bacterium]|jgi:IclR family acetate operon transcriptional repressor
MEYMVPSVQRAIQALEILATTAEGLSLAELSKRIGVPKSTLFRILTTLKHNSLVNHDEQRRRFTLGIKLLDWGNVALSRIDLKTVAHPHLVRMAHETKQSYYLAILDHYEVILIDRVDTLEIWTMVARLGQRSPVHATASGQVLISDLRPDVLEKIIKRSGLKKYTPRTITSFKKLKQRLQEVKECGYSVADAEYKPDLCALAVPIFDHHSRVAAALMMALPHARTAKNAKMLDGMIEVLKQEAAKISQEIGYQEPKDEIE